ncbi:MAG: alkaline phosphatase family protein [Acidobacteriaceae bacterium]|nr:alkaline phosphatase family protein [Acidobacteriaceae bacterium]
MRGFLSISLSSLLVASQAMLPQAANAQGSGTPVTPIRHIVVIFNENISFDHYFGMYPHAANPPNEPQFHARWDTPTVNGYTPALLTRNPNLNAANGVGAANPFRLDRSQALTADQNHAYGPEQAAFDGGLLDLFPVKTGAAGPPPSGAPPVVATPGLVMGYYDGNTVTAMWNYAQHFALNDNSYNSNFGPSTPGALNLVSGQTNGVIASANGPSSDVVPDGNGGLTLVGDADPLDDACSSSTRYQAEMGGKNIGDLLNAAGVTWGWFAGGFNLKITNVNGSTGCNRNSSSSIVPATADYVPHHQPFQYYASTRNPKHLPPSSPDMIGKQDQANHQYDVADFFNAVRRGELPAVSFIKPPAFEDAHPGYSDPLDEQAFVVKVINYLQQYCDDWEHTAVVIAYDDSDGWYDHQMGPIVNGSATTQDALNGPGVCGNGSLALPGVNPATAHAQGRCGYGMRTPLLVISPFARKNFVDHRLTDQSSIIHFIEDNWLGGERIGQGSYDAIGNSIDSMFDFDREPHGRLILSESSGEVVDWY